MRQILVIGTGSIGERHVRCFISTGRCDVSICETDEPKRRAVADKYPIARVFGSVDDALADRLDAVVIATPAHLHVPLAMRLIRQDLHLLIEKPLGTSLEGVGELRKEAGKHRRVAAVAYNYRAHPALQAMRQAMVERRFGMARQLVATCGAHFPTGRPAYRQTYYVDRATGGGAIQDALTHVINAGEWLVGPVQRLAADAAHQALDGVEVEDTVHVLTRQGPVLGCYSLNQYQPPYEVIISVICEGGIARFEFHEDRWRWMTQPGGRWEEQRWAPHAGDATYIAQAQAFLDAVEDGRPPLCSLEEGAQTLAVNLAALRSTADGAKFITVAG